MLKGFKEFIMRGNVVDLAIAVVIGAAFGAVVTALVTDIITPLIGAIGGQHDFSELTFKIHGSTFHYGALINAVISFLAIAAAITSHGNRHRATTTCGSARCRRRFTSGTREVVQSRANATWIVSTDICSQPIVATCPAVDSARTRIAAQPKFRMRPGNGLPRRYCASQPIAKAAMNRTAMRPSAVAPPCRQMSPVRNWAGARPVMPAP